MRLIKALLLSFLALIILASLFFLFYLSPRHTTPILIYHSIGSEKDLGSLDVSLENFRKQMAFIARHNYRVVSLDEYVEAFLENRALAPKSVVITFDDGYKNNYTNACPVLKEYGFPATIFVISNYPGSDDYLSWAQIREMSREGISIGSHATDTVYLPDCSTQEVHKELSESKQAIEQRIGKEVVLLSYPIGGYTQEVIDIARELRLKAACTTNRGRGKNIYALKRIKMTEDSTNPLVMWAKLSGFYNLFKSYKAPN